MSKPPVAGPHTEGRTLGTDWSIANVAKLLRSNASTGAWQDSAAASGSQAAVNRYYLRKTSARHLPSSLSVIFMQLAERNCWYASFCFADAQGLLPWNAETAEQWLWALFGEDRPRVRAEGADHLSRRQFTLSGRP